MNILKKKVALVFGTRPEAIKMAPVWQELKKAKDKIETIVIVTGQHREMLDQVLKQFDIKPDYDLNVMREDQQLIQLAQRMMNKLELVLQEVNPDLILVQGDTTTTYLTSLIAFSAGIPLGHIEAGLRTGDFNRPYPEELNRWLTSTMASIHFAPTNTAKQVIQKNHKKSEHLYLTGNTVVDALKIMMLKNRSVKQAKSYILITAHRRESFGKPLEEICRAIKYLAEKYKQYDFVFPVHLNPIVQKTVYKYLKGVSNIELLKPLEYIDFFEKMRNAYFILTDSGGVQEEAPALGIPVLVMREKTERPEAILAGAIKLVGMNSSKIIMEASKLIEDKKYYGQMSRAVSPYGDGKAAERILQAILYFFGFSEKKPETFVPNKLKLQPIEIDFKIERTKQARALYTMQVE
ncbi:MAG: UDP-N-acetylglucosamine 2-epimerase (non-hydrolyzing) [Candidatus Margulisbacteria bacterium]|nr:UDP-N-acetylglucosamine 2-epimerase (non-hydrolyzing) [Candidatus Margulisiibacteriota bacterium]